MQKPRPETRDLSAGAEVGIEASVGAVGAMLMGAKMRLRV